MLGAGGVGQNVALTLARLGVPKRRKIPRAGTAFVFFWLPLFLCSASSGKRVESATCKYLLNR